MNSALGALVRAKFNIASDPSIPVTLNPQPANPGTTHLTFYVEDLQSAYDELVAAGVEAAGRVTDIPDADRENGPLADLPHIHRIVGGKSVYMADHDGIRIELIEPSRP